MKKLLCPVFIFAFICYIAAHFYFISMSAAINMPGAELFHENLPVSAVNGYRTLEGDLFKFIEDNLLSEDGGILTNTRKYEGSSDTLSESVGLLMDYCVLSGKKRLFDRETAFLKNRMLADGRYVRWRVGSSDAGCNAAVDDFRIIGALLDAYDKWGCGEYFNLAGFLQEGIYDRQVSVRDLFEFYDWKTGKCKRSIPLCYLDAYTVDRISDFNKGWLPVEDKALSIIRNGRIDDASPFYFKYYDYDAGSYSFDEEYGKDGGVCITYTLYTAIHMAEMNEEDVLLTGWLRNEINNGKLYAWYNPYTLKPVNNIESTAVYALAAAYACKTGEFGLYRKLTGSMLRFMVTGKDSRYNGGFGDAKTHDFHSFDNLTALWVLALAGR